MNDTQSPILSAAEIQDLTNTATEIYADVAVLALLLYDSALTISREIQFIWRRRIVVGTILYILARYGTVLLMLGRVVFDFWPVERQTLQVMNVDAIACNLLQVISNTFHLCAAVGVHGLLLARVWAICHMQRWIIIFALIPFLGYIANDIVITTKLRCDEPLTTLAVIGDIFLLILDTVIVILMVIHTHFTWSTFRNQSRLTESPNRHTLSGLLLEQGVFRFSVIFAFSVVIIGLRKSVWDDPVGNIITDIEVVLAPILICGFHLDLLELNLACLVDSQPHENKTLSGFHAAIRHIGESIDTEFGDGGLLTRTNHQEIAQDAAKSGPDISLTEFPWASGRIHELGTSVQQVN